uniref:hypothetical protein n=1 Tax=Actinomadura fibrosa TaxID=111802 RepID=UPI001A9561A5
MQAGRRLPVDPGVRAGLGAPVGQAGEGVDAAAGPVGLGACRVPFGGERLDRRAQLVGGPGELPVALLELAGPRLDLVAVGDGLAALGLGVADGVAQVLGGALRGGRLDALPLDERLGLRQPGVQADELGPGRLQRGQQLALPPGDAVALALGGVRTARGAPARPPTTLSCEALLEVMACVRIRG